MNEIKVKTPAKINLVLEILGKRPDGFHNIQSLMQAVSLFDYLTITSENSNSLEIQISGNSSEIPYNEENIAYKATDLFLGHANIQNQKIKIYIEKNIPVSAGLAGGSSNAAGVLWGLNKLFKSPLSNEDLHLLASKLGSDVNFCLVGGTCLATSRGEKLQRIDSPDLSLVIIKPTNLHISAKEAYTRFDDLSSKPDRKVFTLMKNAVAAKNFDKIAALLNNHLEEAITPIYPEIAQVKNYLLGHNCKQALMSGSGPSVFGICDENIEFVNLHEDWSLFKVKTIDNGVSEH